MSSVVSKDLSHQSFEVLARVRKLSPDFAGDVHVCKGDLTLR